MTNPIKILLVEDHNCIAELFCIGLSNQDDFEVIGIASNTEDAIQQIKNWAIDIILLDLNIPLKKLGKTLLGGIEVIQFIKTNNIKTKIMVLSNHDEWDLVANTAKLGVRGYVLKTVDLATIYSAIRMVHLGGTYFQREVEKQKAKLPQADNEKLIKFAKLTIREKQVIRQISDGFSTKDIADSLKLSIRTVEEYRENVRKKMDAKSIPNMIRIVCENNLLDEL